MEYAERLLQALYLVAMSTTKAVVKQMWSVRKSSSVWSSLFLLSRKSCCCLMHAGMTSTTNEYVKQHFTKVIHFNTHFSLLIHL